VHQHSVIFIMCGATSQGSMAIRLLTDTYGDVHLMDLPPLLNFALINKYANPKHWHCRISALFVYIHVPGLLKIYADAYFTRISRKSRRYVTYLAGIVVLQTSPPSEANLC
jgi:hypothetical protein